MQVTMILKSLQVTATLPGGLCKFTCCIFKLKMSASNRLFFQQVKVFLALLATVVFTAHQMVVFNLKVMVVSVRMSIHPLEVSLTKFVQNR